MRAKTFSVAAVGISLMVAIIACLVYCEVTNAQDCRIIRVYGQVAQGQGSLRLEPSNVLIKKDTCVIWVNLSRASEVKVTFKDGKTCDDASEAPSGFGMAEGCYVTSWVRHGGTSSLTFKNLGTYNYEVEWKEQKEKESGKIVVVE